MIQSNLLTVLLVFALCGAYAMLRLFIFRLSFKKKYEVVGRYKKLRKASLLFMERISDYMLANNAENELIIGSTTLEQYYRYLKSNHASHLSSKYLEKLQNTTNPIFISKTASILEDQELKLKDAGLLVDKLPVLKRPAKVKEAKKTLTNSQYTYNYTFESNNLSVLLFKAMEEKQGSLVKFG